VVNHPHTPQPAATVVADIAAAGGSALAVAADISSRAEYQAMVQRLLGEYGRWDVLVNNAAVAVTKPFPQISEAEFDRSFAVNVKGVFHGLQLAWEHLADGGRIITISSSTTALMLPGYAVYDATKGAVEQFTHILAKEFGPRGITVNAVSPGATETETYRLGKSEQFLASWRR
jgi:3-oxoacyl-[acyl-carrier protein] reductase